ncbi:hypothetical protein DICPUDRAFT_149432 [Dictyostelium purpureum]|uniref:RRM domain-containing protein n=1 Tax=Dictyostelium purpureum TaxID=5786 RepID=F0ZDQ4_DICPU|nr:uncharacterized protein DICPUDRAFT_149432 [Dictyostelium purpureum]EGC37907.1 hypothetical protein DICPUDRAFT_149432 [Dictyostelium purpureum]|eukprot:XP_003285567.1 hypothetical protein DICPUDRAFT_149432 [Dictyostelium purpureum]
MGNYNRYNNNRFNNNNHGGYQPRDYNNNNGMAQQNNQNAIFVGDLTQSIQEPHLQNSFKEFGEIVSIRIFPQRGFAFVNFKDSESVEKAINGMNGGLIEGIAVKVGHSNAGSKLNNRGPPRYNNNFNNNSPYGGGGLPFNKNPNYNNNQHFNNGPNNPNYEGNNPYPNRPNDHYNNNNNNQHINNGNGQYIANNDQNENNNDNNESNTASPPENIETGNDPKAAYYDLLDRNQEKFYPNTEKSNNGENITNIESQIPQRPIPKYDYDS